MPEDEGWAQQVILNTLLKTGDELRSEGAKFPTAMALMTEVSKRIAHALAEEGLIR